MTLWIAGEDQATRARELIGELGFPVAARDPAGPSPLRALGPASW